MVHTSVKLEPGRFVAEYHLQMPHHWDSLAKMSISDGRRAMSFKDFLVNNRKKVVGTEESTVTAEHQALQKKYPAATRQQLDLMLYARKKELRQQKKKQQEKMRMLIEARHDSERSKMFAAVELRKFVDATGAPVCLGSMAMRSWIKEQEPAEYKKYETLVSQATVSYQRERAERCRLFKEQKQIDVESQTNTKHESHRAQLALKNKERRRENAEKKKEAEKQSCDRKVERSRKEKMFFKSKLTAVQDKWKHIESTVEKQRKKNCAQSETIYLKTLSRESAAREKRKAAFHKKMMKAQRKKLAVAETEERYATEVDLLQRNQQLLRGLTEVLHRIGNERSNEFTCGKKAQTRAQLIAQIEAKEAKCSSFIEGRRKALEETAKEKRQQEQMKQESVHSAQDPLSSRKYLMWAKTKERLKSAEMRRAGRLDCLSNRNRTAPHVQPLLKQDCTTQKKALRRANFQVSVTRQMEHQGDGDFSFPEAQNNAVELKPTKTSPYERYIEQEQISLRQREEHEYQIRQKISAASPRRQQMLEKVQLKIRESQKQVVPVMLLEAISPTKPTTPSPPKKAACSPKTPRAQYVILPLVPKAPPSPRVQTSPHSFQISPSQRVLSPPSSSAVDEQVAQAALRRQAIEEENKIRRAHISKQSELAVSRAEKKKMDHLEKLTEECRLQDKTLEKNRMTFEVQVKRRLQIMSERTEKQKEEMEIHEQRRIAALTALQMQHEEFNRSFSGKQISDQHQNTSDPNDQEALRLLRFQPIN